MNLTESIDKIVAEEAKELETQGVFDLIDRHEWFIDRYLELLDEAMADRSDDFFENEWFWNRICCDDGTEDLKMMYAEYCDSYAANEWGDQLWENGIDPWDEEVELLAKDIEIDAAIENKHMCENAEAEEAYFKKEREEAKRAKINRAKWGL